MGNCCSDKGLKWPKEAPQMPEHKWSWGRKKYPPVHQTKDPEVYRAENKENEKITRKPRSLNGGQMQLESCKNCDIYICDYLDSAILDTCLDCRIYIGPCQSSCYIRNSKRCKIVAACGQFRMRDCKDMQMLVYCASKPVIESSKHIEFGCFDLFYFNLQEQFDRAELSVFNNKWSDVYDYTGSGVANYSYLEPCIKAKDLIPALSEVMPDDFTEHEEGNPGKDIVVPLTWGERPLPCAGEACCAVFHPSSVEACNSFLQHLAKEESNLVVTHMRETRMDVGQAKELFSHCDLEESMLRCIEGPIIGVGIFGVNACHVVTQALANATNVFVSPSGETGKFMCDTLFHQFKGSLDG
eukprot:TRINITY_DN94538_c0_g1_i1.p1 TRINITY_DN94538_c0_g1~~TRINITY_DN94538_c0_g1_i1.p1  ORF type:complete len:355 (+),score=10.16 TRINITY_DN94538_c0_g1_i1:52-1116(+)